jgi:Ala-tRNA(Pro) deacylase
MYNYNSLIDALDESKYSYKLYKHRALFTVDDSKNERGQIDGLHSKNLFLKNKKNNFFLFSCVENSKVELKKLSKNLKIGNISFANESYLLKYLGVTPGSVTPFGLLNDRKKEVEFYLDESFLLNKHINFHPLINTATINIKTKDFINFLVENSIKVNILNLETYLVRGNYKNE